MPLAVMSIGVASRSCCTIGTMYQERYETSRRKPGACSLVLSFVVGIEIGRCCYWIIPTLYYFIRWLG